MAQANTPGFTSLGALDRDALVALVLAESEQPSGHEAWTVLRGFREDDTRKSSFYNALARLCEGGYVDKETDPTDGRRKQFRVTERGHSAVRQHAERFNDAL
jgi:DNA-binding PadR family transcriptional regulator